MCIRLLSWKAVVSQHFCLYSTAKTWINSKMSRKQKFREIHTLNSCFGEKNSSKIWRKRYSEQLNLTWRKWIFWHKKQTMHLDQWLWHYLSSAFAHMWLLINLFAMNAEHENADQSFGCSILTYFGPILSAWVIFIYFDICAFPTELFKWQCVHLLQ